ncbi:MAG: SlyX family protein [Pirellulaceae bacterium]|nr:SlyX family protein [Pirellulaceae bacterium]
MARDLTERITDLEIQLAHVQRLFDQLNDVVTDQSSRLSQMERVMKQIEEKVKQIKPADQQSVDPLDEKPPHY